VTVDTCRNSAVGASQGSKSCSIRTNSFRTQTPSLRYLTDATRPDIAYAVGFLGRYSHEPTKRHWRALLRVVQYFVGTSEHGLTYGPGNDDLEQLSAHSYSDWASYKDGRKSTTGNAIMYGAGQVSWRSTMQKSVALSSCEAELRFHDRKYLTDCLTDGFERY
jgi:hypothetical protein